LESFINEFKDKVIVITGGNKGIGKGCAKVFCETLANVVICGRNEKDGEETVNELNNLKVG
jgi:NAD(P)-dependent dehydrogenase (short-subunit alcohol dehydrogenase family)